MNHARSCIGQSPMAVLREPFGPIELAQAWLKCDPDSSAHTVRQRLSCERSVRRT